MAIMMHKELIQRTSGEESFLEFFSRIEPGMSIVLKTLFTAMSILPQLSFSYALQKVR